jgi:RNA polymerase subunit RPABC4/transcription elongation factor Spt4
MPQTARNLTRRPTKAAYLRMLRAVNTPDPEAEARAAATPQKTCLTPGCGTVMPTYISMCPVCHESQYRPEVRETLARIDGGRCECCGEAGRCLSTYN